MKKRSKIESYDFRSFVRDEDWRNKKASPSMPVMSVGWVPVSVGSLFSFDPIITTAYTLVIGAGVFAVILAKVENDYIAKDLVEKADRIADISRVLFPVIAIGLSVYYLIIKNPFIAWIL